MAAVWCSVLEPIFPDSSRLPLYEHTLESCVPAEAASAAAAVAAAAAMCSLYPLRF